jgi:hypothetical protein
MRLKSSVHKLQNYEVMVTKVQAEGKGIIAGESVERLCEWTGGDMACQKKRDGVSASNDSLFDLKAPLCYYIDTNIHYCINELKDGTCSS